MKFAARQRPQTTCAFCKDTLDGALETCAGCAAQYHFECLVDELSGTCAVLGCGTKRAAPLTISVASLNQCVDCQRGFQGEPPRTCPGCGARYHLDCVRGRGTCSREACGVTIPTRSRTGPLTTKELQAEGRHDLETAALVAAWIGALYCGYRWQLIPSYMPRSDSDPWAWAGVALTAIALALLFRAHREGRAR